MLKSRAPRFKQERAPNPSRSLTLLSVTLLHTRFWHYTILQGNQAEPENMTPEPVIDVRQRVKVRSNPGSLNLTGTILLP